MKDKLIAEFNQLNAMKGLRTAAALQGACHNFTIEWISLMFADGEVSDAKANNRMQQLSKRLGGGNAVLQKVFAEVWKENPSSYKFADKQMIAIRGLEEAKLIFDYEAYDQTKLVQALRNPDYSGFLYSFWFPGAVVGATDAHTIGFFRPMVAKKGKLLPTNEFISAFDPNYGEYLIPELEFNYWLNKLKAVYVGVIKHHMLKGFPSKTPPKLTTQNGNAVVTAQNLTQVATGTTNYAAQVAVGAANRRDSHEWQKLTSLMCWDAIFHCAYLASIINDDKYKALLASRDKQFHLVKYTDSTINNATAMQAIPPGHAIGFFVEEQDKTWRMIHVMLSVGGGKAAGNKNDCIGVGSMLGWEVLDLAGGLKWEDGYIKAPMGNDSITGVMKYRNAYVRHRPITALAQVELPSLSKASSVFPWAPSGLNYALANEPVLLNGMKVIFDQSVGLYPVNLESKEEARRNGA
ncbi:hypothetical protein NIES2101_26285 [Calothrix sp. HK-06]|nr:hypothetical protein NIES2101_26285 [Calothrix sp. HK-06]